MHVQARAPLSLHISSSSFPNPPSPPPPTRYLQMEILEGSVCGVTVVTARPRGPGGVLKDHTLRALLALGVPHATVMTGTLRSAASVPTIVTQKVVNVRHLMQLFPEVRAHGLLEV